MDLNQRQTTLATLGEAEALADIAARAVSARGVDLARGW
jgi:hypothetical protein